MQSTHTHYLSPAMVPSLLYVSASCGRPGVMHADALPFISQSILTGKYRHQSSTSVTSESKMPTQTTEGHHSQSLLQANHTPQLAQLSSHLTPEHTQNPKPVRTRVPAVTSKARTTAPENDKSRRNRRRYPRWVTLQKKCTTFSNHFVQYHETTSSLITRKRHSQRPKGQIYPPLLYSRYQDIHFITYSPLARYHYLVLWFSEK